MCMYEYIDMDKNIRKPIIMFIKAIGLNRIRPTQTHQLKILYNLLTVYRYIYQITKNVNNIRCPE